MNAVFQEIWPIVSTVVNLLIVVLGFWLRSTIRIAILELKEELRSTYASKDDLRHVEEKVDLSRQIHAGFAHIANLVRDHGTVPDVNIATRRSGG